MPKALVANIKNSQKFNQGHALGEYSRGRARYGVAHASADTGLQDVNTFEPAALQRYNIAMPLIPPRYHTTYFLARLGRGLRCRLLRVLVERIDDDDAFYWFKENGGMTRANGQRFRETVLSRGGSLEPAAMYRAFAAAIRSSIRC